VEHNGPAHNPSGNGGHSSREVNDLLGLIAGLDSDLVGGSIELLLRQMNPKTARMLRLCAIPHRFNYRLVSILAPDLQPQDAADHYQRLLSLSMVTISGESAQMHDRMRGYLFQKWLEPANEQEFRRASGALSRHFRGLTGSSAGTTETEPYQYRAMFHLIGADQVAGFVEFDSIYRERHHQFRLAECERLVRLASEYESVLTPEHAVQLIYCKAQVAADYRRWEEAKHGLSAVLASPNAGNNLRARAENRLGIIEAAERNYDSAITHYVAALEIAKQAGESYPYSYRIKHDLGAAYRDKGNSDRAEELIIESIRLASNAEDFACVATGYNSLGLLYGRRREMAEAVDALTASISALEKIGDTVREATVYNNLGNIHYDVGRSADSERFYDRSLQIAKRNNDTYGQAVALTNLASAYQQAKNHPRATEALEEATRLFEGIGDAYKSGMVRRKLARLYWRMGRQAEARDSFERAVSHFDRRNEKTEAAETRDELMRLGTKVRVPWWAWIAVIITLLTIVGAVASFIAGGM
jgi:tetratricopeptide (TPR) repeat protein